MYVKFGNTNSHHSSFSGMFTEHLKYSSVSTSNALSCLAIILLFTDKETEAHLILLYARTSLIFS